MLFERLLLQHVNAPARKFSGAQGYHSEFLVDKINLDTATGKVLMIAEPDVRFTRLEDRQFLRTVDATFQHTVSDSIVGEFAEFARDTLSLAAFRKARKGADAVLRGNDPRFWANFIVPAAFVLSGITGIISLFYIRSN